MAIRTLVFGNGKTVTGDVVHSNPHLTVLVASDGAELTIPSDLVNWDETNRRADLVILKAAVMEIIEDWYPEGRIDWLEVWGRLESHTGIDLPEDLLHLTFAELKKHVRQERV